MTGKHNTDGDTSLFIARKIDVPQDGGWDSLIRLSQNMISVSTGINLRTAVTLGYFADLFKRMGVLSKSTPYAMTQYLLVAAADTLLKQYPGAKDIIDVRVDEADKKHKLAMEEKKRKKEQEIETNART